MASSVAAGGTGRLSWNGSTSLACSRLRSSEALTGIVSPRMVRSFLTASAWASSDHEGPQPSLQQVGVLPPRQVQAGVQRRPVDRALAVADPFDDEFAEDRQVGPGPGGLPPRQGALRLGGGIAREGQGGSHIPVAGRGHERPEQGVPHGQEVAKDHLFDLVDGLLLSGGGVKSLDQEPEGVQALIDRPRAGLLLRGGVDVELDGGRAGSEHGGGSSPKRTTPGIDWPPGKIPHGEGPLNALSSRAERPNVLRKRHLRSRSRTRGL